MLLLLATARTSGAAPSTPLSLSCTTTQSGKAVLNEVQTQNSFIELYTLQSANLASWSLWIAGSGPSPVQIKLGLGNCYANGTTTKDNASSGATTTTWPAGTFIACDTAVTIPSKGEVLLVDKQTALAAGNTTVIDALNYGNPSQDEWSVASGCRTIYDAHSAANKDIARVPDGSGSLADNGSNSTKGTSNQPAAFNHVRIEHDGSGSTCANETVTIKACADTNCTALYTGSVNVTLTPTGWVGGDSFSFSGGSTTRALAWKTAGSVTLGGTVNSPAATQSSALCYNGASQTCAMTFTTAATFSFDIPHHWANEPQSVTMTAMKQDLSGACVPAFTSARSVKFWSTYQNPASGTMQASINGTTIATASPGTAVSVTFNASGQGTLSVVYPDAGQVRIDAQDATDTGVTGNDSFVAYPKLCVTTTTANAACASPYNACSVFTSAGSDFNQTLRPVAWEVAGDTDLCTGNARTPNYAQTGIGLASTLVSPSPAIATGALGVGSVDITSGSSDTSFSNQTFSEVGAITITATPGTSYLGTVAAGNLAGTSSVIGRFTPDYFETTLPQACSGVARTFAYSGQPFDATVTAYNKAGAKTRNYDSTAATSPNFAKAVTISNAGTTTYLTANSLSSFSAAEGTASGVTYTFAAFTTTPPSPLSMSVRATDTDAVTSTGHEATLGIRQGRLRLSNAFGPATGSLAMAVQAHYWGNGSWILNSDDSCTTIPASAFALSGSVAGSTTASAVSLLGGKGTLTLTKSNSTTGSVDVAPNLGTSGSDQSCLSSHGGVAAGRAWLRSRNGDCATTWDRDPSARATFGIYAPETSRMIHVR